MTLFTLLFCFNVCGVTDLINLKKSTNIQMKACEQRFLVAFNANVNGILIRRRAIRRSRKLRRTSMVVEP